MVTSVPKGMEPPAGTARYFLGMTHRRIFTTLLALALTPLTLSAQGGDAARSRQSATPGANLVVTLVTMGQGDLVWEKFGHNAIRVRDTVAKTDTVWNWGLFDFGQPGFLPRLIKGEMLYWMDDTSTAPFVTWYMRDDREITEQLLNLTDEQKVKLLTLIRENDTDAKRFYNYNYYLDNCSTRVRDLIDAVIDGQLKAQTDTIATRDTYRSHTRRLLAQSPLEYFGIQLVLGRPADKPLSRWEEMFLPVRLMRYINEVQLRGNDGQLRPLVAAQAQIQRSRNRMPELEEVQPKTSRYLLAGGLITALLVTLGIAATRSRGARISFTTVAVLWCLFAGLAGTFALLMWLFTGHTFMYVNDNVLLMNPLHLVLAALLPRAMFKGRARRAVVLTTALIATLSIVGALLHFIPGLGQENPEFIVLAAGANVALALLLGNRWPTVNSR